MKKEDIFTGTIKKCKNWYLYTTDKVIAENNNIIEVVEENAILIKVAYNEYIPLSSLNSSIDNIMVELGKKINSIHTEPEFDNDVYVDSDTLVPYYDKNREEKIKIRILKKDLSNNTSHIKRI